MEILRKPVLLFAVVLVAGLLAACGDDDGDETATTAAGAAEQVEIVMDDYDFNPAEVDLASGAVTITAPNVGDEEHELELFKSDADPADLPVSGDTVDTEAFEEEGAEEVGEAEAEPGETAELSVELDPGAYVMICNVPGHYEEGMYGSITVE